MPDALVLIRAAAQHHIARTPRLAEAAARGRAMVYLHALPTRIGQHTTEMFALRTLYLAQGWEVLVLVFARFLELAMSVFPDTIRFATRGMHLLPLPDVPEMHPMYHVTDRDLGLVQRDPHGFTLRTDGSVALLGDLHRHFLEQGAPAHAALLAELGIGKDAPLVTVHWREPGYLPGYDGQNFRNAELESYIPAIESLAAAGVHVIRIGDETMRPLPDLGPRVVDIASLRATRPILAASAIARSRFMVNSTTGPLGIACALGVPSVVVNAILTPALFLLPQDVLAPKRFVERATGRSLPLAEILARGLNRLSWGSDIEAGGSAVESLDADDLRAVVEERLSWDDAAGTPPPGPASRRYQRIAFAEHARQRATGGRPPFFATALPWARYAESYAARHPELLDLPSA